MKSPVKWDEESCCWSWRDSGGYRCDLVPDMWELTIEPEDEDGANVSREQAGQLAKLLQAFSETGELPRGDE